MERRSIRAYGYTFFALLVLIMSWESNLASAALLMPSIPEQSIRIRILANSDSIEDQWVKKEVREAIVDNINDWEQSFGSLEEAREGIRLHLAEMERLIDGLLLKYGFMYGFKVELGKVDFPAKVFGKETYPAGEYEALRITLGAGRGENWWCVMFPPLCFGGGAVKAKATDKQDSDKLAEKDVEVRFFAADVGKKIGKFFKGLFA